MHSGLYQLMVLSVLLDHDTSDSQDLEIDDKHLGYFEMLGVTSHCLASAPCLVLGVIVQQLASALDHLPDELTLYHRH